ncbi:MAG: sensor histidine kinase [Opitutales bacterium]
MQRPFHVFLILCTICRGAHASFETYSDPLSPSNTVETEPRSASLFEIPSKLEALEQAIQEKEAELAALPELQNSSQFDAFGYHSDYLPVLDTASEEPRWSLEFETKWVGGSVNFAMVPSVDRRGNRFEGYGFPKRFRLYGKTKKGTDRLLVDWKDQDFPDPGARPVFFDIPTHAGIRVRLEVYQGTVENDLEFFSLARVYCIRNGEAQLITEASASSSFEVLPYWSVEYLRDKRSSLGMPLSTGVQNASEFNLPLENISEDDEITVELDFGEHKRDGWINFYPAQFANGVRVPGFGFPWNVGVQLITEDESGGYGKILPIHPDRVLRNPGQNILRLPWKGAQARWLRLRFSQFPNYQNEANFAMGEIMVERRGVIDRVDRPILIKMNGVPIETDTSSLNDSIASGSPVMIMEQWLRGLAAAKPIEKELTELKTQHQTYTERWSGFWRISIVAGITIVLCTVVGIVIFQIQSKRAAIKRLRLSIARDLHDEVGSNLGSISLMADRIQSDATDPIIQEDLQDLTLLSREASASMRDVIWMTDRSTIYMEDLVDKLMERAKRVLVGMEVNLQRDAKFPKSIIPLSAKRHLLMLFKEIVHNCARHSKATEVHLSIRIEEDEFVIDFRDNGVGFDKETVSGGWGVASMHQRAEELGGSLVLNTGPKQGTQIILRLSTRILESNTQHNYMTSN